ncbi:hypothetical protein PPERSA_12287 [Pseudocohnilembus persalinus]|uniref:NAD(P)-binding domain n=1 Tax=Pseudocohnilembus persalinus TaxID=266149 RepID=A0A0V0R5S6_PSEPJ|nr:hypothetical protein PPERSA_12287 [Pseudocohnilembus persalinus]|eukprot:KRX09544.1 hypothetical protein PPERSA_12287 [Pseudocohnilembus persalinus]
MQRNLLITGANKGLGFGLIKQLCKENPLNLHIILTARSKQRGEEALQELHNQNPSATLQFQQLLIGNQESHENLVKKLQQQKMLIDVLVNNAGIFTWGKDKSEKQRVLQTNYRGTTDFTKLIFPQLTDDAKIIFYSSQIGRISKQNNATKELYSQDNLSESQIDQHVNEFIEGKFENDINAFAKATLNTWVKNVGLKMLKPNQNMFLICPGWCKTDLGGQKAPKSVEQGVSYPFELINDFPFERSERNGQLYSYGRKAPN